MKKKSIPAIEYSIEPLTRENFRNGVVFRSKISKAITVRLQYEDGAFWLIDHNCGLRLALVTETHDDGFTRKFFPSGRILTSPFSYFEVLKSETVNLPISGISDTVSGNSGISDTISDNSNISDNPKNSKS